MGAARKNAAIASLHQAHQQHRGPVDLRGQRGASGCAVLFCMHVVCTDVLSAPEGQQVLTVAPFLKRLNLYAGTCLCHEARLAGKTTLRAPRQWSGLANGAVGLCAPDHRVLC